MTTLVRTTLMDVAKIVSDAQGGSQLLLQPSPLLHLKLLLKEVAPKMADTGVRPGLQACPSRFRVNRRRWFWRSVTGCQSSCFFLS